MKIEKWSILPGKCDLFYLTNLLDSKIDYIYKYVFTYVFEIAFFNAFVGHLWWDRRIVKLKFDTKYQRF